MSKYSIFSAYGIEAEYMIVDSKSLKVKPIADQILKIMNKGEQCNEVNWGITSWSNELVNHVLEVKCTKPEADMTELDTIFHESILSVLEILKPFEATLMPTAMHPWFDPNTEMMLWPHGQKDIYSLYNQIFDCKGHGWSNLQSIHINLPYANEVEFRRLHSAVRAVLPIIPFWAASSPYYESKQGDYADNRLAFYEDNQKKVPSIIGNIIPEMVTSYAEYHEILEVMYREISPYDPVKKLQHPWLNSRAAIVKFDVQAIEIRLTDIQESSYMDFCLINLIIEIIKDIAGSESKLSLAESLSDRDLKSVYNEAKKLTPENIPSSYSKLFDQDQTDLNSLSTSMINQYQNKIPAKYHRGLDVIKNQGSLAKRLIKTPLNQDKYFSLIQCLEENEIYS